MTSDAKIGLLLGLVFIFIIAFLINGLPTFRSENKSNELMAQRLDWQKKAPGIAEMPREVIKQTTYASRPPQQVEEPVQPTLMNGNGNVRFEMSLPQTPPAAKETSEGARYVPANPQPAVKRTETPAVAPSQPALPQVYVVAAGDNLSTIAKRFYGAEEGNKLRNINRIFQANRDVLKSADAIKEGQKIVIPSLTDRGQKNSAPSAALSSRMLEKIKSIGRRHLGNEGSKTKETRKYVVREGDNLWKIAAQQLGDGSRYREIARLNAGTIGDEDRLLVGMQLKMPGR